MAETSAYFILGGSQNRHDGKAIKRELDTLPGVRSVSVGDGSGRVAVDFDPTGIPAEGIARRLEQMGYQILGVQTDGHNG